MPRPQYWNAPPSSIYFDLKSLHTLDLLSTTTSLVAHVHWKAFTVELRKGESWESEIQRELSSSNDTCEYPYYDTAYRRAADKTLQDNTLFWTIMSNTLIQCPKCKQSIQKYHTLKYQFWIWTLIGSKIWFGRQFSKCGILNTVSWERCIDEVGSIIGVHPLQKIG